MWIVRFLNGPLAGQTVPLNKPSMTIGRAPTCDIKVPSSSVSKEHTQLEVQDDRILITDMNSRNGTFLNGVQIRSHRGKSGDRIALHDMILEIQKVPDQWSQQFAHQQMPPAYGYMPPPPQYHGNAAYQSSHQAQQHEEAVPAQSRLEERLPEFLSRAQNYIDDIAMPGVYRIAEMFEFKWVLAAFMAAFILLVTSLSTIPLIRILKVSIEEESQQHALTIATTLARVNRPAIMQGMDTAVSVEIATTRPGVKKALIISNMDGNVIAPASQAGTVPDLPYIHEARKMNKESVKQVDEGTVAAMVPIEFYNGDTGSHAVTAWAVVFYDMSSLAIDNGQVLSLFITTLCISLVLGFLLFYILYKVVEHPVRDLNKQLDTALKEGHDTLNVAFDFPAMKNLASNVSSALNRALSGGGDSSSGKPMEYDRNRELTNLVELIGFAALGINAHDLSIGAANQGFESRTNLTAAQLGGMTVNDLNDQALKLSIKDLIERVDQNPSEMATNNLEFSGSNFQVVALAIYGSAKIAYYLVVLLPASEGG